MSRPAPARRGATLAETLALRETYRDWYRAHRDPIAADRMLWRAQAFRHLAHLLPGQTILELGAGSGAFTRQLARVSRGENPITAVTFATDPVADNAAHTAGRRERDDSGVPPDIRPAYGGLDRDVERERDDPDVGVHVLPAHDNRDLRAHAAVDGAVRRVRARDFPGPLAGRRFDFVVGIDLLDARTCAEVLRHVHDLLAPGGEVVFFESNPWNPVLRARRALARLGLGRDPRALMNRPRLYELLSEVGFIRVFAVFTDFVWAPLTPRAVWLLRNLSIVLENAPAVRTLAGTVLLHAQKPPRVADVARTSLAAHDPLRRAVSVVIPCHNEEMNVRRLVDGLRAHFDEYLHEIVPVDDNSTDGTADVLRALAAQDARVRPVFRTPPNGVGRAIADGYRAATGRWVLSMDCDFQHLLPELRDMFDAAAEGADVVIGSRFSRHSILLNYPFQKIVANRGFHALAQLVLRRRCRDLTNNLKLLRREVIERLRLLEPGFAINAETGLQPLLMGDRVIEVPISWIDRTPDMGTSSFRLAKVGGGYWRVLSRLWLRATFGGGPYRALPVGRTRQRSTTWRLGDAPPVTPRRPGTVATAEEPSRTEAA